LLSGRIFTPSALFLPADGRVIVHSARHKEPSDPLDRDPVTGLMTASKEPLRKLIF
jgi:hypothetical protein